MPSLILRAAHQSHRQLRLLRLSLRRSLGIDRELRILPYRGYGTPARALVKARVLEDRHAAGPSQRKGVATHLQSFYLRYATREIPFAQVRVRWGRSSWVARADEEGFIDQWITPPEGVSPGWHRVHLEVAEGEGRGTSVEALVFIAGPEAELGVISDVDDTVIVTGVRHPLKRARALFFSEAKARLPFEGVPSLYAALRDGKSGHAHNPLFYVSSSPWNLYEHLEEFFSINDLPRGALLLRDWGLSKNGFAPGGGHGHKIARIEEVLSTFPHLPFILMGDSGQEDAEHYLTTLRAHPGRILAIYIRDVTRSPARAKALETLAQEALALGSELHVVQSSDEAARHAASRGWIRQAAAARV